MARNLGGDTSSLLTSQTLMIPMVSAVYTIAEDVEDRLASKVIDSTGRVCDEIEPTDCRGWPDDSDDRSLR